MNDEFYMPEPSSDGFGLSLPDLAPVLDRLSDQAGSIIGAIISAVILGYFLSIFATRTGGRRGGRIIFWLVVCTTAILNLADTIVGIPNIPGLPGPAWWVIVGVPVYLLLCRYLPGRKTAASPRSGPAVGSGTHGSAHFGVIEDMKQRGHIYAPGVSAAPALGRVDVPDGLDARFRYVGHILTCAPTGSGKGIGAVVPTLLEYPGSMVVLDIKGENYAITARHRRAMGHSVHVVDPFNVTGEAAAGFNWLDRLDPNDADVVSESAMLADMIIIPDPKGEAHWDDTARNLLQGILVHVAASAPPERRNMGEVRRLITGTEDDLIQVLAEMSLSQAGFGIVARAANSFLAKAEKERSGVLSTAIKHTAFLDDPRIAETLSRTDFNLNDLKRKPMTVYIVLPPAKLAAYGRFMRGFIGQALAGITSTEKKPEAPVYFLLDEFAQLGRMQQVEDAISLVRGYGAYFWLIVQDLSQLKAIYPRWQTFLANSAKQFFGTADYDTAKYISESLGQKTIQFATSSSNSSTSYSAHASHSSGHSTNINLSGRALLNPDEVMRLGPTRPIVFISGENPYVLERLNYLRNPEYIGLFDQNPYH